MFQALMLRRGALRNLLVTVWSSFLLATGALASNPTLVPQPTIAAPPSIPELARALKYDALLIFEYVHTNIEYSPTFGVKKGALGTLLAGIGNDFDQAALLAALLRTSGYTVNYQYGFLELTAAEAGAYFDIDVSQICPLLNLLTNGGIPITPPPDCTQPFSTVAIPHVWVSVSGGSFGAGTYLLDPSYKAYATASGINLSAAMGYNPSSFLSSAKVGTSYTPGQSIQNVNQANIASQLSGYTKNLIDYIRKNYPTASTRDIIGGRYIQPLTQPYTPPTSLSNHVSLYTWTGDIPDDFRSTFRIEIDGIDKTYFGDAIYGHRISIVYNASGQPVLYLDGIVQGTGTVGAKTVNYTVDFPFCFATTGSPSSACQNQGETNRYAVQNTLDPTPTYTYAIIAGWDEVGQGMVDFHRRQFEVNKNAGGSDTSEPILGQALNVIAYLWLAQSSTLSTVNGQIIRSRSAKHCAVGTVGQGQGPFIDLPGVFTANSSLTTDIYNGLTHFYANSSGGSALEWGTLEQFLTKSGHGAVSTVKLLDLANSQQDVIYDATSANWGAISSQLIGYAPADFNDIKGYIDNHFRVLLPKHGNLTQGDWHGAGYIAADTAGSAGLVTLTYKISSNLKGGFPDFPTQFVEYGREITVIASPIPPTPQITSFDPIDLFSGAFLYNSTDIAVGSAGGPVGLSFGRSYNSNDLYASGPLGHGWTHNFAITASASSDGFKGMGRDSPVDGAAVIAAAFVIQDLFKDPAKPLDKMVVATLAQKWLMDRLINNVVNVKAASQAEQFVLLADGTYNAPLGSSNRLSLENDNYVVRQKDGTILNFNNAGNISGWLMPTGNSVTFGYDASSPPLLTTITNSFDRSLTLSYDGSKKLVAVNDNSSPQRSVQYGYDLAGNLASFTDALGNTISFGYTPPGGPAPGGLLARVVPPANQGIPAVSNIYDSLGRVAAQTNANGSTWTYFFAGYRSEEDDPYGTQHVLYYNPRGKLLFDLQDAADLSLLTSFTYDGLDRLTLVKLPEAGTTAYAYEAITNPWANNIASITRTPKPGSPLSPSTTTYVYEPKFNKPTRIIDALGRTTTILYDSWTGDPVTTTADAGPSPHFNAQTTFSYATSGLIASVTHPMGTVTRFEYDANGNRISATADAGLAGLNLTTVYTYNSQGDVTSVMDPKGNTTNATYDEGRRLISATSPATSTAPAGVVTDYTYDANGQLLESRASSAGIVLRGVSSTYTPTGKVATTTDANGNVTRYGYDLLDRQVSLTDAMGRITQFAYDSLSRPYRTYNTAIQADPLLQQTYTADGKLAALGDARSNITSFAYDGFDRLSTITYPLGSTETFTYDALDNQLSRKTRAGDTITFGYDTLNRLISKMPPSGAAVSYAYDLNGRPTTVSDNSATITPVAPQGSNTVTYRTTYTYDALNRLTGATWDPAPAATAPSPGTLVTFNHTYNKANERISQIVSDSTWLSYPPASPRTTTYAANALNQYTTVGAVTPTYDGNGNLTFDGTYDLSYDAENRLLVSLGAGNIAVYNYDAQGRRKRTDVNGPTTISVTAADNREVLEYDGGTGAVLRWYAYAPGPNAVLNQMDVQADTRATLLPDQLGSIIASFASTSDALSKFSYQPYGASATAAVPFGFTGQHFDQESGLYYYRARHYSTAYGRFLQPDALGYNAGINLYAYVGNNPLNAIDPEGLRALEAVTNALSAVGASATNLAQTAIQPYLGFYQQSIVRPFYGILNEIAQSPVGDPGLYASIQGAGPPGVVIGSAGYVVASTLGAVARAGTSGSASMSQLAINSMVGASFERAVGAELQNSGLIVGQQVSIRTSSGTVTRLDFLTRDPLTGTIGCVECKASQTAPLTPNQRVGFPEIGQSGGAILGAGKPGFPGGMRIPPTDIQIIRGP